MEGYGVSIHKINDENGNQQYSKYDGTFKNDLRQGNGR